MTRGLLNCVFLLGCLAGCGSDPNVAAGKAVCQRYLTCLAKVADSMVYSVAQSGYSESSACWQSSSAADSCKTACTKGLSEQIGKDPACACMSNADCSGGGKCDKDSGKCVVCLTDADCKDDPLGKFCDPNAPARSPTDTGPRCVPCIMDSQCTDKMKPICWEDVCQVCGGMKGCPMGQLCATKNGENYCTQ